MAADLNKVILVGNLTRDPETRYTPSGAAICALGMAINRRYSTRDGQMQEETCFVDVDTWGRQAETCQQYLRKGSSILVEGRLRYDSWEDRETGKRKSRLTVTAERVQFLGSPGGGGGGGGDYGDDSAASDSAPSSGGASRTSGYSGGGRGGSGGGGGAARPPARSGGDGGGGRGDYGGNRSSGPARGGRPGGRDASPPFPDEAPSRQQDDGPFDSDDSVDDIPF